MALSKTLAQLRTALLIRAGLNSSGVSVDLTSTVLNEIINDAAYEAWDVVVGKWSDNFTTRDTIAVVGGTDAYAPPTLFYKLRALWHSDGERLLPGSLDDAHRYVGKTGRPTRYRFENRQLRLMPTPSAAETLTIFHIPRLAEMTADGDILTLDTPIELKYVLATAWRDILDRQSLDPSPAITKMQMYEAKLRTAADNLDAGEPFYIDPRGPSSLDDEDIL